MWVWSKGWLRMFLAVGKKLWGNITLSIQVTPRYPEMEIRGSRTKRKNKLQILFPEIGHHSLRFITITHHICASQYIVWLCTACGWLCVDYYCVLISLTTVTRESSNYTCTEFPVNNTLSRNLERNCHAMCSVARYSNYSSGLIKLNGHPLPRTHFLSAGIAINVIIISESVTETASLWESPDW